MSLDPAYLEYPLRRYGMDHDRYEWSLLQRRPPVEWPGGKRVAIWINVAVEFFPLDQKGIPFKLPGGMVTPYPDLRHFTLRDYGNRVGIYRLMKAFDQAGARPTWTLNGAIVDQLPGLAADIAARGEEIIAHGYDMDSPHHGGMSESDERALVERVLDLIRSVAPRPVQGWLSPGKSESERTPELIAESGLRYLCDWPNDDMPYRFNTAAGPLIAMPHSTDLDDRQIIGELRHHEREFITQITDHYRYLSREAEQGGGRILALNLHPWMIGQSHRIFALEEILAFFAAQEDAWFTSASEILEVWQAAQDLESGAHHDAQGYPKD